MITPINDGGPAFPANFLAMGNERPGMSLRDWFAGQEKIDLSDDFSWEFLEALAGKRPEGNWQTNPIQWFNWVNLWTAKVKFARADAMLAARKEKQQP